MSGNTHHRRRATIPLSNKSLDIMNLPPHCLPQQRRHNREASENMLNEEDDGDLTGRGGGVVAAPGSHLSHSSARRESIFYKPSVSDSDSSPVSLSRKISGNSEILPEDLLITPFAQILHNLKNVRNNYVTLTESYVPSADRLSKSRKSSVNSVNDISDSDAARMSVETLEDLDWCLVQLEKMHTHRSVSDMATTKFKRILSRELNQFSETGSSASEVSEYINSTFLDKHKEDQLPPETDANEYHVTHVTSSDGARLSGSSSSSHNNNQEVNTKRRSTGSICDGDNDEATMATTKTPTSATAKNSPKIHVTNRVNKLKQNIRNNTSTATTSTATSCSNNSSGSSGSSAQVDHCKNCLYGSHKHLWVVSRHLKAPLIVPISCDKSDDTNKQLLEWLAGSNVSRPAAVDGAAGSISTGANKIQAVLQHASDWSFDIFRLADVTNDRPLLILTSYLFQKHNLLKALNISSTLLHNFINSVEQNYNRKNPYHNNIHAADVLQTTYFLTQTPSIKDSLTDMDLIATFVAAAIHDVDHPGVTNQYLVNSELDLAILYNDRSVLENHHLAVGFTILKDRGVNIFRNIPSAVYRSVRRMIIDMVLATDMSMHLKLVADLKTTLETQKVIVADAKASKSASSPQPTLLSSSSSSSSVHTIHADSDNGVKKLTLENLEVKKQVFQNLIHCADLGNPCKPLPIYQTWVERVMKEFFNQGDMEKQQGLDVSPMCNRDMISVEKAQVGFIDYIALPLWEAWDELVSNQCQEALDNLLFNRDWYDAEEKAKQNNQIS